MNKMAKFDLNNILPHFDSYNNNFQHFQSNWSTVYQIYFQSNL
jgi:hypothetical protein